jgi:hypothetical protein
VKLPLLIFNEAGLGIMFTDTCFCCAEQDVRIKIAAIREKIFRMAIVLFLSANLRDSE